MCDPLSILGVAASVGGSFMQAQNAQATARAQTEANNRAAALSRQAREAEFERQQRFEAEQRAAWQSNLDKSAPESRQANQDQGAQQFMQQYDQSLGPIQEGQMLSGQESTANPETQQAIASRVSQGAAQARQRAGAMAKLAGYGDAETQSNVNIGNTNNLLTTIGGLRRGSLGVSQFEQNVPVPTVRPGSSILGDILSGVGGLAARAGGRGGFGTTLGTTAAAAPAATGTPMFPQHPIFPY